ncbi:histidine phosphatase family protein [Pseudorhodobacter sp.]|uniref:histidine phosphatase family protein n=1 Tax=Pseudorhodobacter sp. TaxID=1934400 RepID=UPI0026487466|nr:histidine phosphatase family protein [Pseudorhodobacter sp.]MDN5788560.1 histidine phosphatase family protein [Pseudorhodobacter sp.]
MRLILMRHGETIWNAERRLQGHDNAQLSARGIEQALSFKRLIDGLNPKCVVSSDLGRCRETVGLIGFEDAPADVRLRELNMGEWTGRRKPDLIAEHPENYWAWRAGTWHPKGGEAWQDFVDRVVGGLRDWLKTADGDVLAVVHSGVIRAALNAFLGLSQDKMVPVTPGTATMLHFDDPFSKVVKLEGYNLGLFAPQTVEAVSD